MKDGPKYESDSRRLHQFSRHCQLGRSDAAFALASEKMMPEEVELRRTIKRVVPSGWRNVEYSFIEGKVPYNRCHLIGCRLTGEHANGRKLITGARYMNHAMHIFENMVAGQWSYSVQKMQAITLVTFQ